MQETYILEGDTVIIMRTATATANTPAASTQSNNLESINNSNIQQNTTITQPVKTLKFDHAMFELLKENEIIVQGCLTILLKIILNIVTNPTEEKYRKLNKSNTSFDRKVGSLVSSSLLMIALGM